MILGSIPGVSNLATHSTHPTKRSRNRDHRPQRTDMLPTALQEYLIDDPGFEYQQAQIFQREAQ